MPQISTNGVNMYYEVHGSGEPVLLIQGLGANHRFWKPLVPIFSRNHQVILCDWRGTGYSSDAPDDDYATKTLAADVAGFLAELGLERVHVVGRSMGGCIAQYLAIDYPSRVHSLILASTWGRADAFLRTVLNTWPTILEGCGDAALLEQASAWAFPREFFEREQARVAGEVNAVIEHAIELRQRPQAFRRLSQAGQHHDALAELHKIRVPTAVMVGREDILTPMALARELYQLIPRAQLIVFEGAGHGFYEQLHEKFADIALEFWSRSGVMEAIPERVP